MQSVIHLFAHKVFIHVIVISAISCSFSATALRWNLTRILHELPLLEWLCWQLWLYLPYLICCHYDLLNYLQKHINVFRCLQLKDIVRSGQDDFEFKLNDWSNNVEEFVDSGPRDLRQNLKMYSLNWWSWISVLATYILLQPWFTSMFPTWVKDFPVVWMTISCPNEIMKGNKEYKYDEAIAGNRASSLNNAELIFVLLLLSKVS